MLIIDLILASIELLILKVKRIVYTTKDKPNYNVVKIISDSASIPKMIV